MKNTNIYRVFKSSAAVAATALLLNCCDASAASADALAGWKEQAISPVANPLFFESPLIQSEVRPSS